MSENAFRSQPFDLAVNTISDEDIQELISWLQGYPRLTMADETKRFEEAWSDWLGCKYSVTCNSGSSANLLMYAALDSSKRSGNKKIIVPATGWVTTIAPAIQLGWSPVMCESSPTTFALDPETLEELCKSEKPDAVIVVHPLGVPADIDRILELQKTYGFELLEDCCASHGAEHKGQKVGTFGTMSSFSFYYGHHMSSVEGGVVSTNDKTLYEHLLMNRSHGWLKDLSPEQSDQMLQEAGFENFHSPFMFSIPGYNLRPTDISSHIGLKQLEKLDATVDIRTENHAEYQRLLKGQFHFAEGIPGDKISSISFCAVAESSEERKKIVNAMVEHHIDTRIFTAGNLGRHPFWTDRYGVFSAPQADRLYNGGFFLPNNQSLGKKDVGFICDVILRATAGIS